MTDPVIIGDTTLYRGDALEIIPTLEAGSVDAVVTDPPAGIGFMGKKWDHDKGGRDQWITWMSGVAAECLRVLKPGGYALVWALPRTSHWTATAWENAGFEVRDRVAYLFGSGFPKSLNVALEFEHELCEYRPGPDGKKRWYYLGEDMPMVQTPPFCNPMANQWVGWGTALKPAVEDWWLLRKPLEGTVAANVLAHGTGGLNIDACRIGTDAISVHNAPKGTFAGGEAGRGSDTESYRTHQGRWPANLVHDGSEEVVGLFPRSKDGVAVRHRGVSGGNILCRPKPVGTPDMGYGGSGSAARFFYCAKANKADRDEGLDDVKPGRHNPYGEGREGVGKTGHYQPRRNSHPTVKPTALMRWLVRLVTPPGGVVLDPFMGSGSTGKACAKEGFRFLGLELDAEYFDIACRRIEDAMTGGPLLASAKDKA